MTVELNEVVQRAAEYMALSAKTAPKARGIDFVDVKILKGEELKKLAEAMIQYGEQNNKQNYDRDGKNIMDSDALLLLALTCDTAPPGLNCGACGKERCADLHPKEGAEFMGPICAWRLLDLGVALGSAVKTASLFNLDNRIMYRAGAAARKMGFMEGQIIVGIPVSATEKNIYFDRQR